MPVLDPIQKKRFSKRFSTIEASFRIEGMDPHRDPIYRAAKLNVLKGSMTPKEALAYVVRESTRKCAHQSLVSLAG
jgi:hypothetical protein